MKIVVDERPLPADCETMLDVRKGVDALDRALVLMLAERQRYMDAKRDKMGHILPPRPCCSGEAPAAGAGDGAGAVGA